MTVSSQEQDQDKTKTGPNFLSSAVVLCTLIKLQTAKIIKEKIQHSMMLSYHRGCVVIKGPQVNEIAQKWINQCQDVSFQKSLKAREGRDDTSDFHITAMTPKEKKLTNFDVSQYELLDPIGLYDLGIGPEARWNYCILCSDYITAVGEAASRATTTPF